MSHICICICTYIYTHTYIHTYTHTYTLAYVYTHTHPLTSVAYIDMLWGAPLEEPGLRANFNTRGPTFGAQGRDRELAAGIVTMTHGAHDQPGGLQTSVRRTAHACVLWISNHGAAEILLQGPGNPETSGNPDPNARDSGFFVSFAALHKRQTGQAAGIMSAIEASWLQEQTLSCPITTQNHPLEL